MPELEARRPVMPPRPTATLFLLLKIGRLDERDLEDCRNLVATGEEFDATRIMAAIDALPEPANEHVAARRADMRRLVSRG